MATLEMLDRLPQLDDDDDIGKEIEHVVRRDGEPDLRFVGVLLASAAPESARMVNELPRAGRWMELRIYRTIKGKYIFSEVGRTCVPNEIDKFKARVFDPTDRNFLLGVNDDEALKEAAQSFFSFTPLAKKLYAKANIDAAEFVE